MDIHGSKINPSYFSPIHGYRYKKRSLCLHTCVNLFHRIFRQDFFQASLLQFRIHTVKYGTLMIQNTGMQGFKTCILLFYTGKYLYVDIQHNTTDIFPLFVCHGACHGHDFNVRTQGIRISIGKKSGTCLFCFLVPVCGTVKVIGQGHNLSGLSGAWSHVNPIFFYPFLKAVRLEENPCSK